MKILVLENIPPASKVWWYEYTKNIPHISVEVLKVGFPYKSEFLRCFSISCGLFKKMRKGEFDWVITFENGIETFVLSFWQSFFRTHKPAHAILDFIMREKDNSLTSKVKFAFLRFCYSSVRLIVCSSRHEIEYYKKEFKLPNDKIVFIPLYVRPIFLKDYEQSSSDYIISAGKTFRDYDTLLKAVEGLPVKV